MSTVHASYAGPPGQVADALVRAGQSLGWSFAAHKSPPGMVVLEKGLSLTSWGSTLMVQLQQTGPELTRLTVTSGETMAAYDWGRGKRNARKLLDAIGAQAG